MAVAMGMFGTMEQHAEEELPDSFAYVETEKLRKAHGL